jgi:hypothetical protein
MTPNSVNDPKSLFIVYSYYSFESPFDQKLNLNDASILLAGSVLFEMPKNGDVSVPT